MILRCLVFALAFAGLAAQTGSEPPSPPPAVESAIPGVEPLTLDTLLGDWGYYDRNQQRRTTGFNRSCVQWDRDIVWLDFDGEQVPLYGGVKFVRAGDGTLWRLTESGQDRIVEAENPNGDLVVLATAETEVIAMLRSDLHNFREAMALTRIVAGAAEKAARAGHPVEFFEFRIWNTVHYPTGEMPEGAARLLKCIPGKSL